MLSVFALPPAQAIEEYHDRINGEEESDFRLDGQGSPHISWGDHGLTEALQIVSLGIASSVQWDIEEGLLSGPNSPATINYIQREFDNQIQTLSAELRSIMVEKFQSYLVSQAHQQWALECRQRGD